MVPQTLKADEIANWALKEQNMKISPNALHLSMTHTGEATAKTMAQHHGTPIESDEIEPCHACVLAKARQANLKKLTDLRSKIKGDRLCMDLSWTNIIMMTMM